MNDDTDSLRAQLNEEAASPEEAEALLPAMQALRQWPAPAATPADTRRLLARLGPLPAVPVNAARLDWRWLALILRSQVPLVRREVWLASTLVYALGVLVTLAPTWDAARPQALPFVLLAPAIAAVGCGCLFGAANDEGLELVLALPVPPRVLLLARLTLLLAFDLALGLAGSAALVWLRADVLLWPLVRAWLAPMAFLAALGFLLSVVVAEPLIGIIVSLGVWCALVLGPAWMQTDLWARLPDLNDPSARLILVLAGLALAAAGLWLGGREERWLPRAESV